MPSRPAAGAERSCRPGSRAAGRTDGPAHHAEGADRGGRGLRDRGDFQFVALGKDADAWVRRTNVQELRVLRSSDSQRQGDVAIDNFGPEQVTMLTDFVITHPTAATSSYRTGQSGVAAAKQEAIKEGKYGEAAAALNIRFIPFAMETYGKMGTKALRILRTLQQDLDDSIMVACDLGFWDKEARVGTDQRASRRRRAGRSLPFMSP